MEKRDGAGHRRAYRLFHTFGASILHHRIASGTVLAALCAIATVGVLRLEFDSNPRRVFQSSDADFDRLKNYFEDFGADDRDILLVLHGEEFFTAKFSEALREFIRSAAATEGVGKVLSILDIPTAGSGAASSLPASREPEAAFEAARDLALEHPVIAGQVLSADGKTMLVNVRLSQQVREVAQLQAAVEAIRSLSDEAFSDLVDEVFLAGHVAIRVDTLAGLKHEFVKIMGIASILSALIALALFRSLSRTLIVAAGPAMAVFWTLGLMGWAGLKIDGISTPLPMLIFVVAFANAIHLMVDFAASERLGRSRRDASVEAIAHLGLPCCLTSLTSMIGFGSLALAQTDSVQRFGLASAAGVFLGLVANLSIVPLLASFLKSGRVSPPQRKSPRMRARALLCAGNLILRRPRLVTTVGIVLSAGLLIFALRLGADINWTETLPRESETARATVHCDEAFGGALQAYVVVSWDASVPEDDPRILSALAGVHALVEEEPLLTGPLSLKNLSAPLEAAGMPEAGILPVLRHAPSELIGSLYRPDLRRAALSVHVPNVGAARLRPAFGALAGKLDELARELDGFEFGLTGSVVVASENITLIIRDLLRSLSFASVAVFLILSIGLRSLTLGLLSIIPNAFPLLLNAGLLSLLGQPLQITSALTFTICLGIAVDDTIHFLMRFLRERDGGLDLRDSILRAFESVGTALVITSLIIIGGFASTMASEMPALVLFGMLSCIALCAAMVGDLIILPAMMMCTLRRWRRNPRP